MRELFASASLASSSANELEAVSVPTEALETGSQDEGLRVTPVISIQYVAEDEGQGPPDAPSLPAALRDRASLFAVSLAVVVVTSAMLLATCAAR